MWVVVLCGVSVGESWDVGGVRRGDGRVKKIAKKKPPEHVPIVEIAKSIQIPTMVIVIVIVVVRS